jgi:hypothetical protein
MKADPYVMKPVRQAQVQVIGRMWMPADLGTTTYDLSDDDLTAIDDISAASGGAATAPSFTRDNVSKWLRTTHGDFQEIVDFRAVCGSIDLPWQDPKSEATFTDLMFGFDEQV